MPNYENAVIPSSKLSGYALNMNHPTGKNKAIAFKKALGYTNDNENALIVKVRDGLRQYRANARPETQHGKPFEVIMMLQGPNGKYAKVKTAWIIDSGSEFPRLVTIYVDN